MKQGRECHRCGRVTLAVVCLTLCCAIAALGQPIAMEIVVNSSLQPSIQASLDQYCGGLRTAGYQPTVTSWSGGTPASLRGHLQASYAAGTQGAVFIGDLPVAWYEMDNDFNNSYSTFPIDLFYMDMDGSWADGDSDGLYDAHTAGSGDVTPELWFGRVTASPLGNEAAKVNAFLQRCDAFRHGTLSYPDTALVYIDDDWVPWATSWNSDVQNVYGTTTLVSDPWTTTATDYKTRIGGPNSYESLLQCVHSSPTSMSFKTPKGWDGGSVLTSEIPTIDPNIAFYNCFDCSLARFTSGNYMAGNYVFGTSYGLAGVGSTKTGSMLEFDDFYIPLSVDDATMGTAFRDWFTAIGAGGYSLSEMQWHYGMTLLGDPTLGPNSLIVPEPCSAALLGGLCLVLWRKARRRH